MEASLTICESAVELENAADLSAWSWYTGAYQQYHTAVFLLMEVYRSPNIPQAARIGVILDHVFGRAPGITSHHRNEEVLKRLIEKLNRLTDLKEKSPYSPGTLLSDDGKYGPGTYYGYDHNMTLEAGNWEPDMIEHGQNEMEVMHRPIANDWWYASTHYNPGYDFNLFDL